MGSVNANWDDWYLSFCRARADSCGICDQCVARHL